MVYTGIQDDTRYPGTLLCYRQFWHIITCYGTIVQTEYVCAGAASARYWYSSRLRQSYHTQKERKQHTYPKVHYISYAAYILLFFLHGIIHRFSCPAYYDASPCMIIYKKFSF
uniref:PI7L n=1 Tax=African swine fever virus TaxID=10497 RepID=A0A649YKE2_ASF